MNKNIFAAICLIILTLILDVMGTSQTTLSPNQVRTSTTPVSQITESITVISTPAPISFPACPGFLSVLRNGLDQTVGTDYTLSQDKLSITFIMISQNDLIKIRCFH